MLVLAGSAFRGFSEYGLVGSASVLMILVAMLVVMPPLLALATRVRIVRPNAVAKRIRAATDIDSTILQPSVIFGEGDSFFNRFASLLKFAPVLPLACPGARMQPVWVGDVVAAIAIALQDPRTIGKTLPLVILANPIKNPSQQQLPSNYYQSNIFQNGS